MRQSLASVILLAAAALTVAGCSDYKARTADARQAFYSGDFETAGKTYAQKRRGEDRDRLLYYLDAGMAFHAAGRRELSNKYLVKADDLIEELNFSTGAGAQTAAVLTDDRALPYVGEEFEAVLVNAVMALNFLVAGGPRAPENALVECRRLDWKLREFAELRKRPYLQNAFARYLSGVAFEMDREPNDAYIEYKLVHKLRPDFEPVRADLVRLAWRLGFRDDAEAWEKKFGIKFDRAVENGTGEVVLVYQCGRAPVKVQRDELLDLPVYKKLDYIERGAVLSAAGLPPVRTQTLEDVEATAIKTLEDRMGPILARRAAKAAIKTAAAVGVHEAVKGSKKDRKEHPEREALAIQAAVVTFQLLNALDQADTRSWLTLPASFQVARMRLPVGAHTMVVEFQDAAGNPTGHRAEFAGVPVQPGRITVLTVRSLR
ncbi:MAG TPA: hypothetical protein PK280_04590 [Planctomycetota bacterium]|nr:hypothetical protein [Planctomycetota bacterium]